MSKRSRRLTDDEISRVSEHLAKGKLSQRRIADLVGVSTSSVYRISNWIKKPLDLPSRSSGLEHSPAGYDSTGENSTNGSILCENQPSDDEILYPLQYLEKTVEEEAQPEPNNLNQDTMQLVIDHEGNPEWKCSTCDFRDSEQEIVVQHYGLAHSKKGPVSLVHAVHRCNVCGFAAGTKRHVLLHIENNHGGQGSIISRSEGQNINQEKNGEICNKLFNCHICPYTCKKQADLKKHTSHHTEKPEFIFKCVVCPYFVATKGELFEHLNVHSDLNMEKDDNSTFRTPEVKSKPKDDTSPKEYVCDLCPFDAKTRAKLLHHRQFHRPRGLPFSCHKCTYNVTRENLLTQHLKVHGIISSQDKDGSRSNGGTGINGTSHSKSPSPSLTITAISSVENDTKSPIDPSCLPNLSDELTRNMHDIPLVWVSKDGKYFKMFKCRQCPHVNLRKTNIQEHEKMHRPDSIPSGVGHQCQFCSYNCINAGVMTSHLKVHSGGLGKCHAIVDPALPNEDQLFMLSGSSINFAKKDIRKCDEKMLYYCQYCPSRFFFEKEVIIHSRFHTSNFANQCEKCNFKVREPQQLLSHAKVHTPEYQERTRTLMTMHPSAPAHLPVAGNSVSAEVLNAISESNALDSGKEHKSEFKPNGILTSLTESDTISQPPPTSRFKCDKCPSTFSKMITLQYHQSLHSANNPFKCPKCTYAAKTEIHLDQHVALHNKEEKEKAAATVVEVQAPRKEFVHKPSSIQETLGMLKRKASFESLDQPPIKLKLIGMKGDNTSGNTKQQFKYYIEEQVPLSGVELLKRKNQIESEMPKDTFKVPKLDMKSIKMKFGRPEDRIGNPSFHYPMHIDRVCGRTKEKRYKCMVCPSAFEKLDQFNVHLGLHGSNYKYKCRICDYSVKFYANFMMHIKRHKYHEKLAAQEKGLPDPAEDDPMFQPFIGVNPPKIPKEVVSKMEEINNKENRFDIDSYPDMTTTERQHLLLQEKKGDIFKVKDDEVDKKVFYCQHCPYANKRRDAVDSHTLRHEENNGKGVYICHFCDYTAATHNFIREHTKVHFRPFKFVQPAGFMRNDKLELFSICVSESSENGSNKSLIISHEEGTFLPLINRKQKEVEENKQSGVAEDGKEAEVEDVKYIIDDYQVDNGICVDFRAGDIVDAPAHMK